MPAPPDVRVILFESFREAGGWRVRIDGENDGHYPDEKAALNAAQAAAHVIVERGGVAELTYGRVDGAKS